MAGQTETSSPNYFLFGFQLAKHQAPSVSASVANAVIKQKKPATDLPLKDDKPSTT